MNPFRMLVIIIKIRVLLMALPNNSAELFSNHVLRLTSYDVFFRKIICYLFYLSEYVEEGHVYTISWN